MNGGATIQKNEHHCAMEHANSQRSGIICCLVRENASKGQQRQLIAPTASNDHFQASSPPCGLHPKDAWTIPYLNRQGAHWHQLHAFSLPRGLHPKGVDNPQPKLPRRPLASIDNVPLPLALIDAVPQMSSRGNASLDCVGQTFGREVNAAEMSRGHLETWPGLNSSFRVVVEKVDQKLLATGRIVDAVLVHVREEILERNLRWAIPLGADRNASRLHFGTFAP